MTDDKKVPTGLSLPPTLAKWAKENAPSLGFRNRNDMIQQLLEAARDGRLNIRPRGPDAFPAETVAAGTSPDHPIFIGLPPEPDPLINDAFPAEGP